MIRSMSMKIQKPKIFILTMIMSNNLLNGIDRRMILRRRIDITTIQINTICIHSIMPPCHSIWIYYRKYIKYKFISQKSYLLIILRYLLYYSCHNMRTRYLSWVHPRTNYKTLLLRTKFFRLVMSRK